MINEKKLSPVFLRDLSEVEQIIFIGRWKANGNAKLLNAYEDGDDITVGYYLDEAVVE